MASKIILKKSSVAGKIPQPQDLEYGELALNYTDGILYFKGSNNNVTILSSAENADPSLEVVQTNAPGVNYITFTNKAAGSEHTAYIDTDLQYFPDQNLLKTGSVKSDFIKTNFSEKTSSRIVLNSTTNAQVIDNITTNNFESAEYTIQVVHPEFGKQISKLNILYDDAVADSIEYGIVFTQAKLADFNIVYSGSTISVMANPQISNCIVKYVRTLII